MKTTPKHRGFTLIELVVAISVLGMILASSGMVFKITVESKRMATANSEIMQKFRVISMQMDSDFQNIQKDAPLTIWFQSDANNRYDKLMFFSSGDFQSIQHYTHISEADNSPLVYKMETLPENQGAKIIRGHIARVFYGIANIRGETEIKPPWLLETPERVLSRRMHILTADQSLIEWPDKELNTFNQIDPSFPTMPGLLLNDRFEHDALSLSEWKNLTADQYIDKFILDTIFTSQNSWISLSNQYISYTLHNLMCEGVENFTIQWAYWDEGQINWFPSDDLDGNKSTIDSQFILNSANNRFGVIFGVEGDPPGLEWKKVENIKFKQSKSFGLGFYPAALKFTIRLYDSKGIIKDGRVFTKIVYLGERQG